MEEYFEKDPYRWSFKRKRLALLIGAREVAVKVSFVESASQSKHN